MMEDLKGSKEVDLVGSENLDGTSTNIYESKMTLPAAPGPAAQPPIYSAKIWVGVADGMPQKVESSSTGSPIRTTIIYTDYNASIAIEPPVS